MIATRALPLLILRGEPGASATAARAEALGLRAVKVPLFAIEPVDWAVPDVADFDRLLLTSANAVRHAGAGLAALRGLPCWCVGEATADAARGAGLTVERIGTSDAASLLADAPQDESASQHLLWLTGEHHVGKSLQHGGPRGEKSLTLDVRNSAIIVYRARALDVDPERLKGPAIALLHSPRAAQTLEALAPLRMQLILVVISPAVAKSAGKGWHSVTSAALPKDAEMLAIAAKLCHIARG
ncbi:MAG: uroporphyrinogen-III synthase [Sphingopyxis sp.]